MPRRKKKGSLIYPKSYDIKPTGLLPSEPSLARDFVTLRNPSSSAGFEPVFAI
jgi:hypothetical protein